MAARTAKQIQGDVYALLMESPISSMISGGVYRSGMRPRDSRLEDAVVIFTAGLPTQIQSGVVTINIYVPDIDPFSNGVLVEDALRTSQVEIAAAEWVNSLANGVSDYLFSLRQTICTETDAEINQHFVVIKLGYKYFGNN